MRNLWQPWKIDRNSAFAADEQRTKKHFDRHTRISERLTPDNRYISAIVHFTGTFCKSPDHNEVPGGVWIRTLASLILFLFCSPELSLCLFFRSTAFEFFTHHSFCIWGTKSNFSTSIPSRLRTMRSPFANNFLYEYIINSLFSDSFYPFHTHMHTQIQYTFEYFFLS